MNNRVEYNYLLLCERSTFKKILWVALNLRTCGRNFLKFIYLTTNVNFSLTLRVITLENLYIYICVLIMRKVFYISHSRMLVLNIGS